MDRTCRLSGCGAAPNRREEDARHYICKVLASRRAHYGPRGACRDFFPPNVSRNAHRGDDTMRYIRNTTLFFCLLALSCSKNPAPTSSDNPKSQMLVNPTFEWNGAPSLHGWSQTDSLGFQFSKDTPPGGIGNTLVLLPIGRIGEGIQQILPAVTGTHVYSLTFFGKNHGLDAGANVDLHPSGGGGFIGKGGATAYDTTWAMYSVVDTFTANMGDSLYVWVGASGCQNCQPTYSAYINSIRLVVK